MVGSFRRAESDRFTTGDAQSCPFMLLGVVPDKLPGSRVVTSLGLHFVNFMILPMPEVK